MKKCTSCQLVVGDGENFCPRCGRMTVKDRLHTNALSRHATVYVCDACGTDEASTISILRALRIVASVTGSVRG